MTDDHSSSGKEAAGILFPHALWQHYTVFDGLAGMRVEDILQDRQGFIWIATADGGVSRFDGVHFDNFTCVDGLPHPTVMSIAEGADGRLWFGTLGGGLAVYDGHAFQTYTTADGLPSDEVRRLRMREDGALQVATRNGMGIFVDGRCVETVTTARGRPIGFVCDLVTDSLGQTWLATMERGVIDLDGRCLIDPAVEGRERFEWAWRLEVDGDGCMWIAPMYTGIDLHAYRYDPQLDRLERMGIGEEGAAPPVRHGILDVRCDRRGWMWITHRGVMVSDREGWKRLSIPLHGSSLSDTKLTYEDREGNVWVGFWGGGVACCDPMSVQRLTEADGLPDEEVTGLAEDAGGRIWIGTMNGVARMERGQIEPLEEEGWPAIMATSLVVDRRGRVWSGSHQGKVYCWGDQNLQTLQIGEGSVAGRVLYEDRQGELWVGSEGGLERWEEGQFVPLVLDPVPEVHILFEDHKGDFWLGAHGEEQALFRYDGRSLHAVAVDDQASCYIYALCETPDGTLWIGTGTGLLAYRDGDWRRFTIEDGLSENAVLALAVDAQGNLWIGTSGGGAVRYDGQTFQIIRLGNSPAENIVEAILVDGDGQMWCGTRAGLVSYNPGSSPPGIVIRRVIAGRIFLNPESVSCSENTPEIRILFRGIGFRADPRQMRYSYRLMGEEGGDWTPFGNATTAVFSQLKASAYRFEVRAMDRDGLCSSVASLELTVTPDPRRDRIEALEKVLRYPSQPFIGQGPAMEEVLTQIGKVADTELTVLILGETGTGKGLAAHLLHEMSGRREGPFIHVNCGALPEGIITSELFGHEKGAFTGAVSRKLGRFELAEKGTLFLDEIGDLPLESQRVLLQVLEEGTLQRVGGEETIQVDVRVLAATNRDLQQGIGEGTFREDLFYRLSEFVLLMPPLRQRLEDLPLLVSFFAEHFSRHLNRPTPKMSPEALERLRNYEWPGNIRELEHLVQRAVLLCSDGIIRIEDMSMEVMAGEAPVEKEGWVSLEEYERRGAEEEKGYLERALEATGWVIYGEKGAAELLGVHPEKLRARMKKYDLRRPT